ncbi:TetR/AcrR family transcriptional regulator [Promicromonospora sukumoe]|uniref:TetR/AcrR family transcriptional regulator n=1 Tax=Promicromonospora sukumoe TaxID=88382 RepID=UPI0037CBD299
MLVNLLGVPQVPTTEVPVPKISDARRDARRAEILEAARRAFAAKGYQHTSMAEVIAEAGLSTGAVYGYFEGKRELFAAVARTTLSRRSADLEEAAADGDPPTPAEVLEIVLQGVLSEGFELPLLLQLWGEATVDPEMRGVVNMGFKELRNAFRAALTRWFEAHPEHAPDGAEAAAEGLLPVLMGIGQGYIFQSAMFDEFDSRSYLDAARRILPR